METIGLGLQCGGLLFVAGVFICIAAWVAKTFGPGWKKYREDIARYKGYKKECARLTKEIAYANVRLRQAEDALMDSHKELAQCRQECRAMKHMETL